LGTTSIYMTTSIHYGVHYVKLYIETYMGTNQGTNFANDQVVYGFAMVLALELRFRWRTKEETRLRR